MMKKITFLAAFLIAAMTYGQINNGDFETAAGADWAATYYDAIGNEGSVNPTGSFEATGGNPNGYFKFIQGDILGNNQQASALTNSVISAPITLALNDELKIKVTLDAKSDMAFNPSGGDTEFRLTALIPQPKLSNGKASNKNMKFEEYLDSDKTTWKTLSATTSLTVDNINHDPNNYTVQIRLDFGKFPVGQQLDFDNVSVEFSVNDIVLSIERITKEDASLSLYPNPVTNHFTVNSTNHIEKIEVYNLLGQKIMTRNSPKIDVSKLSKGIYISKIHQENDVISTKRFVKE